MPTYDYKCTSCNTEHEIVKGIKDPSPILCSSCGALNTLERVYNTAPKICTKGCSPASRKDIH